MKKMTPFLWFNRDIAEVVEFYRSVFPDARISDRMPGPGGTLMSATFELDGQRFIAFNGGPHYDLSPAVSMYINCESQEEVDQLWEQLLDGGRESRCGWLVDRFGLSWQIIPSALPRLLGDPDPGRAGRARDAMMKMQKIDTATMERAAAGE
jgi:predicted 3-demethylubiquinone-9 3-methyltransferase (glyoxalase superfamily)